MRHYSCQFDAVLCNLCQINALARRSGCLKRLRDYDPSKSRDVSKDIAKMWKEHIQKHRFAGPGANAGRKRVRTLPEVFLCAYLDRLD